MRLKDIRNLEKAVVREMKKALEVQNMEGVACLSDVLIDLRQIESEVEFHPEDIVKKKK